MMASNSPKTMAAPLSARRHILITAGVIWCERIIRWASRKWADMLGRFANEKSDPANLLALTREQFQMKTTSLSCAVAFLALATASPTQAQQCTVPNTLVNGQVADATEVMDNFNAVAACADDTKDDAVTHEGTPDAGEIAVFTSPTASTTPQTPPPTHKAQPRSRQTGSSQSSKSQVTRTLSASSRRFAHFSMIQPKSKFTSTRNGKYRRAGRAKIQSMSAFGASA